MYNPITKIMTICSLYHNAVLLQVHEMEASQHALTAKSSDDIDSLQKTKVELEERVKSLEINLQEKTEVCICQNYTYLI